MATSWLNLNPGSGAGNGTIAVGAQVHTGRVARQGSFTVTGAGVAAPVTVSVTQSAKTEFVSFDSGATHAVAKAGGSVTITGKTNSSKLTFSWLPVDATDKDGNKVDPESGINYPEVTLPAKYSADGVQTNNAAAITDDPGAVAEFAFSITLSFPANGTMDDVYRTLKVTANGGQSAQVQTIQAAASASLQVSPTEVTIPAAGTPVSVTVTANTTWTVG